MKKKRLEIRLSERRLNKLRLYAVNKDKSMTAIIEDLIDTLPESKIGKNLTTQLPVKFLPRNSSGTPPCQVGVRLLAVIAKNMLHDGLKPRPVASD